MACFNPVPVGGMGAHQRGGDGVSSVNGALVKLEDLKVWFPIKSGIVLDRHIGNIRPSTA